MSYRATTYRKYFVYFSVSGVIENIDRQLSSSETFFVCGTTKVVYSNSSGMLIIHYILKPLQLWTYHANLRQRY